MSLLDLPKPRITAQARPGTKRMAEARLKEAQAKLANAQARHKRAATILEKTKAQLAKSQAAAESQQRAERMAWERVANVMREYERIQRACTNG